MTAIPLLLVVVTLGTGGELCLARAMKQVGEVRDFRPATLGRTIIVALRVRWTWLSLTLLVGYLCALLALLSVHNVSAVVPMTALSYVVGAVGGKFFLGERVTLARWLGVCLVCAGVTLVFVGS
jgi:uncharacterized membrane protein